jgi:iron-sulfur cluster repair protein YtfE (RIC family)
MMNAIQFLLKEHEHVRKVLADISNPVHRDATKREMLHELCQDLIRHEMMEEEIWYPQLRKHQNLKELIKHLISEEKHAEKAMLKFDAIKTQDEWETKFEKFKQDVEHHAAEEENDLFPLVERIVPDMQLQEIYP